MKITFDGKYYYFIGVTQEPLKAVNLQVLRDSLSRALLGQPEKLKKALKVLEKYINN